MILGASLDAKELLKLFELNWLLKINPSKIEENSKEKSWQTKTV